MKTRTRSPGRIVSSAIAIALLVATTSSALESSPAPGKADAPRMMDDCAALKAKKQFMRDEQVALDADLTRKLDEMNRAPDARKPGLMASILTQSIEQRISMDARRAVLEDEMMQHVMQHVMRPETAGAASMGTCPMMKPRPAGTRALLGMPSNGHENHQAMND